MPASLTRHQAGWGRPAGEDPATTFALIRSALIRAWELRSQTAAPLPDEGLLTDQAFSPCAFIPGASPCPR